MQPPDVSQWWLPDLHEPKLVRKIKVHSQVERRDREGRRRERIQAGRERLEQEEKACLLMKKSLEEGMGGRNREWMGGERDEERDGTVSSSPMTQVNCHYFVLL